MATLLAPHDPRLSWRGAITLERSGDSVTAWRIPFEDRMLYHEALRHRAAMAAGVRVAFRTDATTIGGTVDTGADTAPIDLVIGDELIATHPLAGRASFRFDGVPEGEKVVELWLPQVGEFRLRTLELNDDATIQPAEDARAERPKWIAYGSSITHCGTAASPALTWPGVAARGRGLDLTCLGFGAAATSTRSWRASSATGRRTISR